MKSLPPSLTRDCLYICTGMRRPWNGCMAIDYFTSGLLSWRVHNVFKLVCECFQAVGLSHAALGSLTPPLVDLWLSRFAVQHPLHGGGETTGIILTQEARLSVDDGLPGPPRIGRDDHRANRHGLTRHHAEVFLCGCVDECGGVVEQRPPGTVGDRLEEADLVLCNTQLIPPTPQLLLVLAILGHTDVIPTCYHQTRLLRTYATLLFEHCESLEGPGYVLLAFIAVEGEEVGGPLVEGTPLNVLKFVLLPLCRLGQEGIHNGQVHWWVQHHRKPTT
mmetsp:Transcript_43519/g.108690  ORF Transcript_43519/g.108690 Transcript_43519/m.108690 type:complete len:276 (+) Transcript_43519:97-924(+)